MEPGGPGGRGVEIVYDSDPEAPDPTTREVTPEPDPRADNNRESPESGGRASPPRLPGRWERGQEHIPTPSPSPPPMNRQDERGAGAAAAPQPPQPDAGRGRDMDLGEEPYTQPDSSEDEGGAGGGYDISDIIKMTYDDFRNKSRQELDEFVRHLDECSACISNWEHQPDTAEDEEQMKRDFKQKRLIDKKRQEIQDVIDTKNETDEEEEDGGDKMSTDGSGGQGMVKDSEGNEWEPVPWESFLTESQLQIVKMSLEEMEKMSDEELQEALESLEGIQWRSYDACPVGADETICMAQSNAMFLVFERKEWIEKTLEGRKKPSADPLSAGPSGASSRKTPPPRSVSPSSRRRSDALGKQNVGSPSPPAGGGGKASPMRSPGKGGGKSPVSGASGGGAAKSRQGGNSSGSGGSAKKSESEWKSAPRPPNGKRGSPQPMGGGAGGKAPLKRAHGEEEDPYELGELNSSIKMGVNNFNDSGPEDIREWIEELEKALKHLTLFSPMDSPIYNNYRLVKERNVFVENLQELREKVREKIKTAQKLLERKSKHPPNGDGGGGAGGGGGGGGGGSGRGDGSSANPKVIGARLCPRCGKPVRIR